MGYTFLNFLKMAFANLGWFAGALFVYLSKFFKIYLKTKALLKETLQFGKRYHIFWQVFDNGNWIVLETEMETIQIVSVSTFIYWFFLKLKLQ